MLWIQKLRTVIALKDSKPVFSPSFLPTCNTCKSKRKKSLVLFRKLLGWRFICQFNFLREGACSLVLFPLTSATVSY